MRLRRGPDCDPHTLPQAARPAAACLAGRAHQRGWRGRAREAGVRPEDPQEGARGG